MSQSFLLILIIGIGISFALLSNKKINNSTAKHQQKTELKPEQNNYLELRKMAFSVTPEILELKEFKKDKVFGIISEIEMNEATVTVASFATGDTSIYLSSGGGFIGAGQHEDVRVIVKNFIKNGQIYLEKANKIEEAELPKNGMTNFNFMTSNGIYSIKESTIELESGKSEFSKLFIDLNKIISQIRIKSGK